MRFSGRSARLLFPRSRYPRQSLEAAARALGLRARVFLQDKRRDRIVIIRPPRSAGASAGRLRALAGAFADAALNHAYRQKVVRFHARLSAAVLVPVLEHGFRAVPADPLEQLEPQVRQDRDGDVAALLEQARRMGGA